MSFFIHYPVEKRQNCWSSCLLELTRRSESCTVQMVMVLCSWWPQCTYMVKVIKTHLFFFFFFSKTKKALKSYKTTYIYDMTYLLTSHQFYLQSNLNSSNTDGSFTMANSNSFFESLRNSSDSLRKQIFTDFSYYIMKLYVVCTH